MKNAIYTIIACVLIFQTSFSQGSPSGYNDQLATGSSMLSLKKAGRTTLKIKGSPYIIEEFQPITITGQENKNFQGKYNGYNGDMEVLDVAKGSVFVLNKYLTNYDVTFIAQAKTYKSYQYKSDDGEISNGFFVKLSENNGLSLLKKEVVKFLKEIKAETTLDKTRPAQYRRSNDIYFIKINDNVAVELSTKKKEIAKLFPENSKAILGHIKSNKLNTKNEADLIKLVNYISGL